MEQESSNIEQTSDQIQATSTPADLLQKVSSDSKIKTVNFTVPFRKDISLIDFSISSQGQDEDKIYALTQWYRHNVRRGNTIIQTFDEERKVQETFIGRKGFEKFFDLSYEYLQYNLGEIKDLNVFGMGSLDEHHGLYDAIFAKASQIAQENHKIAVYKLGKANGENAQVSWIEGLGAWLIASKNVSLLARNEEDVKGYNGDRFHYVKVIAKEWFKIVDRIEKDGQIEALKEYMKGKTLVGELCGNQEYQHLVRYTTMQIFFVAIVENNSDITCLSPSEAIAAFDKFNLAHVKFQEMGIYSNWNELNEALKKIYVDVAKANIDSEEEGAVIYLVKVSDNQREETLSLSKLKTLEYRIYRKLREKLKAFSGHKKRSDRPWKEFYNQYCEETQSLCKEIKPPMPLEFYFHIAREAFDFAEKNPKKYYIIQSQYITFISMLLYTLNKGGKLNSAAFDDKTIVQTVLGIPWTEHYQAYKPPTEDETMLIENNKPDSERKKVRVVVPIGIPGMGKTYFLNMFTKVVKENGCELSVISSDAIRKECMDKLAKSNKRLKTDQLYDKTGRDAKNLFNDRLRDLISQAKKKNSRGYFIFIDKNHPPNAIKGTIDFIYNSANSQVDVELIALVPQMEGNLLSYEDQGKQHNYPFSPNFFFNCFSRVQSRKDHETLTGAGAKSADVMIMFLQMFRNIQLDKDNLAQNGFHKLFSIPFTAETAPTNIPPEIQEVCFEVLKATQPGDKCKDQKLIAKLNDIYESHGLQFLHPEPNLVEESVNRFFQEEIIPELPAPNENNEDNNQLEVEERKEDNNDAFENDAKDEYNPSRLPLYLGIFAHGHPVAQVKEYVLKGLDVLAKAFPQDNVLEEISKDLTDNKPNELDFTSDFHITSLFIGKNERLRESKYFKTFKPRHQMHIEIAGFVIVPGKIATAICYPDDSPIQIQNRFPHVTIMKGKWAPKFSNDVLEAIFGEDGPLKGKYQKEEFSNLQEFTHKTSVRISCGSGTAYVVMVSPHLRLLAEARSSDDVPS